MLTLWNAFDDLLRYEPWLAPSRRFGGLDFQPAVNISEDEHAYVVTAELPGVKPADVHVELEGNVLTVWGERRWEDKQEREGYRRIEQRYGAFSRSFTLPDGLESDAISADLEYGVLTLRLPKDEKARPRRIDVKSRAPKLGDGKSSIEAARHETQAVTSKKRHGRKSWREALSRLGF